MDQLDELINSYFEDDSNSFARWQVKVAMVLYANKFNWIKTTCGKTLIYDNSDYEVLRQQKLFFANDRNCVMAVWKSKRGKKTVAPVAKLLLGVEGKAVIHYIDRNPLNLKRNNLEVINRQKAHFKQRKSKLSNPTSTYKGVSWNKFAKKWSAYIKINYHKKHLGYFSSEKEAALAYNKAAIENWGSDYSLLNVVT